MPVCTQATGCIRLMIFSSGGNGCRVTLVSGSPDVTTPDLRPSLCTKSNWRKRERADSTLTDRLFMTISQSLWRITRDLFLSNFADWDSPPTGAGACLRSTRKYSPRCLLLLNEWLRITWCTGAINLSTTAHIVGP